MKPVQLVLLVEGEGDRQAAPVLIKRLLRERDAQDTLVVAPHPIAVGDLSGLRKSNYQEWRRLIEISLRNRRMEACLLLLDGDEPPVTGKPFCARESALELIGIAKERGAGHRFSLAVVFACMEFESWLIAGIGSLTGKDLIDKAVVIPSNFKLPVNIETAPRDAKKYLHRMLSGYRPTRHQAMLTEMVDLNTIREQNMRSFRRLENALDEMILAIREGRHVASPIVKP